jgi:hypothetical protein
MAHRFAKQTPSTPLRRKKRGRTGNPLRFTIRIFVGEPGRFLSARAFVGTQTPAAKWEICEWPLSERD